MRGLIRWAFGMTYLGKQYYPEFRIQPNMVNPDHIKIDAEELKHNESFIRQCEAARRL